MPDPYRMLRVRRGATDEQIRSAYRQRAKSLHPDRFPPERRTEATRRFQELQEAYATLCNPRLRLAYDASHPAAPRLAWRRPRRRELEAVEDFFVNLLRGMMR